MRIGIFTECYRPITNGVVVSVETCRQALLAQGHDVWLFTPDYQAYEDPSVIPLRSFGLPSRTAYRCALPLPRRRPPGHLDVVHAHSPFSTGLLARWWAGRHRCPLIFTYHTRLEDYAHYLPLPAALARRAMVFSSRTYCNWSDLVVTPTAEIRRLLQGYGVRRPIEVLPTAVSVPGLERADRHWLRQKFGWPRQRILLTVGRLAQEKNVPFLLESFARVHQQRPDTVLVVVGDGPDKAVLQAQVDRLELHGAVIFSGMVARSQIAQYYGGADLFVFASLTETQGLVVGEALQAGLPVVAVGVGGVRDALLGKPGSMTCAPDAAEFAMRVVEVLDDPTRLGRPSTGRNDASETARRLVELYQQAQASERPVTLALGRTGSSTRSEAPGWVAAESSVSSAADSS